MRGATVLARCPIWRDAQSGEMPNLAIPQGDDSPGGRFPRGFSPRGMIPLGGRFPGGNDPPGPNGQGRGSRIPAVAGSNPPSPPGAQIRPRWPRMLRSRFWFQNQDFGASVGAICIIFRDLSVPTGPGDFLLNFLPLKPGPERINFVLSFVNRPAAAHD